MRVVRRCGYDGAICEKYPVKLDDKGYIQKEEIKCTLNECEHCYFMGKPWVRTEIIRD